jgi:peptide/nickel transport system substrate-binding protein
LASPLRLSRARFLQGAGALAMLGATCGVWRPGLADESGLTDDYRAPAGRATPGGTLRVSVALDTGSLDPHALSHTNVEWIGRILFDNLVYLDPAGRATPWLAKSWTISSDGLVYTFQLRNDVTFSDGSQFDAQAVLLNLEHMRDPATKSPLAGTYIRPYARGWVVDQFTFEATLHEPYTPFLNVLAQSWLAMESPRALRKPVAELLYHPVGSGPFILESYVPQRGMRFVRRPDYNWAPDLIGHRGPAYLDRLEFEFVPDASVRYFALAAGEYDMTVDAPPQAAARMQADPALRLTSRIRMGCPNRGLSFNVTQPPFDDVAVRRAAALAIDRNAIARIAGFGLYAPNGNFLSRATPYYDPTWAGRLDFDPAAANRLLDGAGWTGRDANRTRTRNGQPLSAGVMTSQLGASLLVMTQIQADLREVGFDLRLEVLPTGQLVQQRNGGQYQAVSGGVWHTNTPDALFINYHGSQIPSLQRSGQNVSRLSDMVLDDVLSRARQTSDPALLRTLYSQAQQRLIELLPSVPLYENQSLVAYRANVRGIVYDTSHETPHFIAVSLAQAPA